jgi:hypothetical protein
MSGRTKWAIVAVVGVLLTLVGGFFVVGPRKGVCRPPILEVMRDDPTESAVLVDLTPDVSQNDKQAVKKKLTQIDDVLAVRTPTAKAFVVTGKAGAAEKVQAAVTGDAAVVKVTALAAEDPKLKSCKDDATKQLAVGAPVLIIGLGMLVFGIVRYHRAGLAAAPPTPAEGSPPQA